MLIVKEITHIYVFLKHDVLKMGVSEDVCLLGCTLNMSLLY